MEYEMNLANKKINNKYINQSMNKNTLSIIFLFIIMFTIMIYPNGATGANTYIPYFLIGIVVIVDTIKRGVISKNNLFWIFIIWILLINLIMASINNLGLFYSIKTSVGVFSPLLSYMLGQKYVKILDLKTFSKGIGLLLLVQFLVVLFQSLGTEIGLNSYWIFGGEKGLRYLQYLSYGNKNYQSIGTIGNPNELGIYVLLLLAFLMFCNNIKQTIIIAFTFMSFYIVISSQSRTAIIIFSFLIFFRVIFTKRKSAVKLFSNVTMGILIASSAILYAAKNLGRALSIDQLESRYILWENLKDMVYEFDGLYNFFILLNGRGISYIKQLGSVDNTYYNIFLSSGVIGIILFVLLISNMILKIIKIHDKRLIYLGLSYIFIFLISCIVIDIFFNMKVSFLLFFVIGYLIKYNNEHMRGDN